VSSGAKKSLGYFSLKHLSPRHLSFQKPVVIPFPTLFTTSELNQLIAPKSSIFTKSFHHKDACLCQPPSKITSLHGPYFSSSTSFHNAFKLFYPSIWHTSWIFLELFSNVKFARHLDEVKLIHIYNCHTMLVFHHGRNFWIYSNLRMINFDEIPHLVLVPSWGHQTCMVV